jgi:hypothetical protein
MQQDINHKMQICHFVWHRVVHACLQCQYNPWKCRCNAQPQREIIAGLLVHAIALHQLVILITHIILQSAVNVLLEEEEKQSHNNEWLICQSCAVCYSTFYTLHTDNSYIYLKYKISFVSNYDLHSSFLHLFDFQSKLSEMFWAFTGQGINSLPSELLKQPTFQKFLLISSAVKWWTK